MSARRPTGLKQGAAALLALMIWPGKPLVAQVLEEIVVTAQGRAERLSDVPISITAVSGTKIADSQIERLEELSAYVASFTVQTDPIGDFINIRGIQSGTGPSFEQSVATFVDGIYRGRGIQSRWAFLDLERVEVLRGPQPVLFGNNAVAGALNISTARPTEHLDSEVSAFFAPDFDETELQGHVSSPLSANLRARFAFLSREVDDGWVFNRAYGENTPRSDELFARLALEWEIGDATTLSLKHEGGDLETIGLPLVILRGGPISPFLLAAGIPEGTGFETVIGNNGFSLLAIPGDPTLDFGSDGELAGEARETRIKIEHHLESGMLVTGIAGHSAFTYERYLDADFGPLPTLRYDDTEDFEQSSLELRLTSATGKRIEYIAGLYLQDTEIYSDGLTQLSLGVLDLILRGGCAALPDALTNIIVGDPVATAVAVAGLPGATASTAGACGQTALIQALTPLGVEGVSRHAFLDQSTDTVAAFAQLTWNIDDRWRAVLGLRNTSEDKVATQAALATDYAARNVTPLADQSPADPRSLAAFTVLEFTPHSFGPSDPGMRRSEDRFMWSANVQWDMTDATLLYASAATGSKAGGLNSFYLGLPRGAGANAADTDFDSEEVLSLEIGAKMTLLDGVGELNMAVFSASYEDLQVSVFSGDTSFVVQNAAESTSRGIELEGRWRVADNLTLQATLSRLDFEFDRFPNQSCVAEQYLAYREAAFQQAFAVGGQVAAGLASLLVNNQACAAAGINDMKGRTSAHTPELATALGIDYRRPMGRFELGVAANIAWSDDVYRVDDLDPLGLQSAYTNVNAVLSLGPADRAWDVALIGKNLTDEATLSFVNDTPLFHGGREAMIQPRRSVGLRGRVRF